MISDKDIDDFRREVRRQGIPGIYGIVQRPDETDEEFARRAAEAASAHLKRGESPHDDCQVGNPRPA